MPDTEPLTAERLDAIEADLDAAWSEAGETSPIIARAVNGSYILLARYQRLAAEVDRLRDRVTTAEKLSFDNGLEAARLSPFEHTARGWQQRAEAAEAEVRKRGDGNRVLSGLYADACRKLDAVRAFSAGMREYCSPYGVSFHYANQLDEVLGDAPPAPSPTVRTDARVQAVGNGQYRWTCTTCQIKSDRGDRSGAEAGCDRHNAANCQGRSVFRQLPVADRPVA